jgi:hypothetical protein
VPIPLRRRSLALVAALAAAVALFGCGDENGSSGSAEKLELGPLPDQGDLLFVVRGPADVSDGRIAVDTEVVDWFTDRPERRAGEARVADLVRNWEEYGFDEVAPNAAVSSTDSEDVVELSDPRRTESGVSFDYKVISGQPLDGGELSLFIDSSNPYRTSMRVYIHPSEICESELEDGGSTTTIYENPQIIEAPNSWIHEPVESAEFPAPDYEGDPIELFNAAAHKGSVSFEVRYDIDCLNDQGHDKGVRAQISFRGSVGDTFNKLNHFNCDILWGAPYYKCDSPVDAGYHVDADAQVTYNEDADL